MQKEGRLGGCSAGEKVSPTSRGPLLSAFVVWTIGADADYSRSGDSVCCWSL